MSNEDFLVETFKGMVSGMELNIALMCEHLSSHDESLASSFQFGRAAGYSEFLGAVKASLRLYDAKVRGEIPQEMIDILERKRAEVEV